MRGRATSCRIFKPRVISTLRLNAELDKQADRVTVVYKVDRGSRHRVSEVRFEGNKYFTQDQLAAHVIVEKGKYFNRGKFSQDLLKKSVASLTALYRNEGFTKAKRHPRGGGT